MYQKLSARLESAVLNLDLPKASRLLKKGADPMYNGGMCIVALHTQMSDPSIDDETFIQMLRLLQKYGAQLRHLDDCLLQASICHKRYDCAHFLLEAAHARFENCDAQEIYRALMSSFNFSEFQHALREFPQLSQIVFSEAKFHSTFQHFKTSPNYVISEKPVYPTHVVLASCFMIGNTSEYRQILKTRDLTNSEVCKAFEIFCNANREYSDCLLSDSQKSMIYDALTSAKLPAPQLAEAIAIFHPTISRTFLELQSETAIKSISQLYASCSSVSTFRTLLDFRMPLKITPNVRRHAVELISERYDDDFWAFYTTYKDDFSVSTVKSAILAFYQDGRMNDVAELLTLNPSIQFRHLNLEEHAKTFSELENLQELEKLGVDTSSFTIYNDLYWSFLSNFTDANAETRENLFRDMLERLSRASGVTHIYAGGEAQAGAWRMKASLSPEGIARFHDYAERLELLLTVNASLRDFRKLSGDELYRITTSEAREEIFENLKSGSITKAADLVKFLPQERMTTRARERRL